MKQPLTNKLPQLSEDFEREDQKDKLYLLEQIDETEKTALLELLMQEAPLPHPDEAILLISDHPKAKKDEGAIDLGYTLPF